MQLETNLEATGQVSRPARYCKMAPRPYFNEKGEVLSFEELMRLHEIDDRTFKSHAKAYEPTGGANGAYGGFIYALSAWAAAQTVQPALFIHVE